jgi:hypothetical protein
VVGARTVQYRAVLSSDRVIYTVHHGTLGTVLYSTMQRNTIQCSAIQYNAAQYNTM